MQVSGTDIRIVLAEAIGGFLLAGVFSLGNLFARKKVGDTLACEATALDHVDPQMRVFLSEIQTQTTDKIAFLRLVGCVDRLLALEAYAIEHQSKIMDPYTLKNAKIEYTMLADHMDRIVAKYKAEHLDQNQIIDFTVLMQQTKERIYQHLTRIATLVSRTKQF